MLDGLDIRMVRDVLDAASAVHAVTCPEAGGVAVFLGTTRAQSDAQGKGALLALDYAAYEEMALKEITKLAKTARSRWPIARLVVWHRVGPVPVASASVVIAVSCPHRGEAFDACEFLIDELKKLAPIWKKEIYEKDSRWQGS